LTLAEIIAEGYYPGTITSIVANEKQAVCVRFQVSDGVTRVSFWHTTPASLPYTVDKLKRIGFNGNIADPDWDRETIFEWQCRNETYNGTMREAWDIAASGPKQAAPDVLVQLQSKLDAVLGAPSRPTTKPSPARPTPAAVKPAAAPPPDDEPEAEPAVLRTAKTKGEAWEIFCELNGPDAGAKWKDIVRKVSTDSAKREAQFSPAEWQKVADESQLPF